MTPEEIAAGLVQLLFAGGPEKRLAEFDFTRHIADAIRDAYERAADVCEDALYETKNSCSEDAIYDAVKAIRALKGQA